MHWEKAMLTKSKKFLTNNRSRLFFAIVVLLLCANLFGEFTHSEDRRVSRFVSANASNLAIADTPSQDIGAKRAQIAMEQYELKVTESTPGCNCGKVIDKYTDNHPAQWCTMFASWVTKEAGSPVYSTKTNSWRITNSREFANYLQMNGTWHSRQDVIDNKLEPEIGDFIVYWRGDFDDRLGHVDIVVNPGKKAGYADTVGGNLHNTIKLRNFPYRDNYGFLGFGRPEKP
jgi:hypothetical protein